MNALLSSTEKQPDVTIVTTLTINYNLRTTEVLAHVIAYTSLWGLEINHVSNGGIEDTSDNIYEIHWSNLDNTTISVHKYSDDYGRERFHVMILIISGP